MRKISAIIIHCSDTPAGRDIDITDVRRWHLERGFNDVGYHYFIKLDGTIQEGRSIEKVGAHALGRNASTVGVCYAGGRDGNTYIDTRTDLQKLSMRVLVRYLAFVYDVPNVYGHNVVSDKACPCFDAHKELYPVLQWVREHAHELELGGPSKYDLFWNVYP